MKLLDIPFVRPIAIVIVFSLVSLVGIYEYSTMKYELIPAINMSYITVQTVYPGASPAEVEDQVTKKIEDAVSVVSHIRHVSSQSLENASVVALEFDSSADMSIAIQDVQRVVNASKGSLPSSVKDPSISKMSLNDYPVMQLAVTGGLDRGQLYQLVKDTVKPRLNRIGGIGQVAILGGNAREIQVSLSQSKLELYGIPILLALQKIGSANLDFPAGNLKAEDGQYVVRIAGKLKSLDELRELALATVPGAGTIRLGDVASVESGLAESESIFRYNGEEAVGMLIYKQSGTNAVEISKQVSAELSALEREFAGQRLRFRVADDASVFTLGSAHDVLRDILLAIVFVGVIMILFLHDLRNAFIVMMAIPVTLLATFICMGLGHFSLNMMSLLALTLVIGILVDDSIVVVENIHRHKTLGKKPKEAARFGTGEIAFAASSVTLVIVVSFLPVSVSGGLIGAILLQFGLTLVIATAISLVVSLFLTPLLASKLGETEKKDERALMVRFGNAFDRFFGCVTRVFLLCFDWTIRHKKATLGSAVALLALSFTLLTTGLVGSEFMIGIDRGEFNVEIELPERSTLEANDRTVAKIESILKSRPEVATVYTKVGYDGSTGSSNFKSSITVGLVDKDRRSESSTDIGLEVEDAIRSIPGVKVRVSQIGLLDIGSSTSPIEYQVLGQNYGQNMKVAGELAAAMRSVAGTGEVSVDVSNGKPELRVSIDRSKLADLGLSLDTVGTSLRLAMTGNDSLFYSENGVDYPINVKLDSFDRTSTAQLETMTFANAQGRQIRLNQFATVASDLGPTKLTRVDRQGCITVTAQAIGRPSGDISADIRAKLSAMEIPADVRVSPAGLLSMQSDAFGSLGFALVLSIILIYAILAILFNSLSDPLSIMFCLPFALIGGFFALALTGQTLNIFSIMSMILLMGLSAKNAILLVDRALKNRDERGLGTAESFREAVSTRIRPIFMTTLAMVVGMTPIAFGLGSAGEMKQAMGIVLIGGLVFGLIVTMILVPVAFLSVDRLGNRHARSGKTARGELSCAE